MRADRQELFQQYGQCLYFDVTYNVFKRTSDNGNEKSLGLGIFSGISYSGGIIIFGFCIMAKEGVEEMVKVFEAFFTLIGGQPATIVSDEQQSIVSGL